MSLASREILIQQTSTQITDKFSASGTKTRIENFTKTAGNDPRWPFHEVFWKSLLLSNQRDETILSDATYEFFDA